MGYPQHRQAREGVRYGNQFFTEVKTLTPSSGAVSGDTTNTLNALIWAITIKPATVTTTWKIDITGKTSGTVYKSLTSAQTGTQTVVPGSNGLPVTGETLTFAISAASVDELFTITVYMI